MERVFTDKTVTAKKHYRCDASEQWRRAGYTVDECETDEQRLMGPCGKDGEPEDFEAATFRPGVPAPTR